MRASLIKRRLRFYILLIVLVKTLLLISRYYICMKTEKTQLKKQIKAIILILTTKQFYGRENIFCLFFEFLITHYNSITYLKIVCNIELKD
jgi:hypothetical protein